MAVKQRKEKENRINVKLFKTQNSVRSRPSLLAVLFLLRLYPSFSSLNIVVAVVFHPRRRRHHQFCHFSRNESVRTMCAKQLLIKNIKWIQEA